MSLYDNELSTLNNYILSHDSWTDKLNCSYFASGAWNSVSSITLDSYYMLGYYTPKELANSISSYYGYKVNLAVNYDYGYFNETQLVYNVDI